MKSRCPISAALVLGLLAAGGCDDGSVPLGDLYGPSPVSDLVAVSGGTDAVELTWTAPRAHTPSGRVARYMILYSSGDTGAPDWNSASQVPGPASPQSPGSLERFILSGLQPFNSYSIVVQSADEQGNRSALSNRVAATVVRVPRTQGELIENLQEAYARRDYDIYRSLFPAPEDSLPFYFFLDTGGNWDGTEELRIHRRMFLPQAPLTGETPVPQDLWLVSIDIQLTPQTEWTERPDLYRSASNPTGVDPGKWRVMEASYHAYVFFKTQGLTDYMVNGRENFVVVENLRKQPGEARKFLIYWWEDLGSVAAHSTAVEPSSWGMLKRLYR